MPYASKSTKSKLLTAGLVLALSGIPALAQNSGGNSQETKPAGASQAELPSIEKLTEMANEAVGGRENLDKIGTLHTEMSVDLGGMVITMDNKWSRDGGLLTKSQAPWGSSETGTDGAVAWSKQADGSYVVLNSNEAEEFRSQASMHMSMMDPRVLKQNADNLNLVSREEFNDRMAYKLRFEPKGTESYGFMFFDVANGMPLGMQEVNSTPMGEEITTMTLGDWKTIEGVKFFQSVKIESPGMPEGNPATMKVAAVEVNKLDKNTFALPPEVKELAANSSGSEEEADETDASNEGAAADEIKLEDLPESLRDRTEKTIEVAKQGGPELIASTLETYEKLLPNIPEGDNKLMLQYMIQELKKAK